ncbi:MAG: nucleotidyltransferase domain-containing protein [Nanoarchaeota archaeon]
MIKYQKSMMKIMENVLFQRQEKSIEKIIQETKTGRNSAFSAINWLGKNGMIKVKKNGNQNLISPVIDNYTLNFKYYLDSFAFKSLDSFVKLISQVFISGITGKTKVKSVILFGSALKEKKFNDIDFLLLGKGLDTNFIKSLSDLREKIERVFGIIINIHQAELNIENIFTGIVIYQSSYFEIKDKIKFQYFEFLDWIFEAVKNQSSEDFQIAFNNSVLNLSYVYCYMNNFNPETKSEAVGFFRNKYKINNLNELKTIGGEIGKELFK